MSTNSEHEPVEWPRGFRMTPADGGAAFPTPDVRDADSMGIVEGSRGMSLRDYFAVHADQPGVAEIVAVAGGETDGYRVKFSAGGTERKFNDWWNDLPLADRLSLSARVRYAMADAMLAERVK